MSNLTDFLPVVESNPTVGSTQTSNMTDHSSGSVGGGTTITINADIMKLASTANTSDPAHFQLGNGSYIGHEITFLYDEPSSTHALGQAMVWATMQSSGSKSNYTVNSNDNVNRFMWMGNGWSYLNDWQG